MEKGLKIGLAVIVLAVIAIAGYFLFFQAPSFEQEYKRMALSWKDNGVTEERLHSADEVFSSNAAALDFDAIQDGLVSFKNSAKNQAAGELAGVYSLFVESARLSSTASAMRSSLSASEVSFCENLEAYEDLGANISELIKTKEDYLNAVNSFVAKYPSEAQSISLYATANGASADKAHQDLLDAISVAKEVC